MKARVRQRGWVLLAAGLPLALAACDDEGETRPVDAGPPLRAALPAPASLGPGWGTVEVDEFAPSVESGDFADTLACVAVQVATQV